MGLWNALPRGPAEGSVCLRGTAEAPSVYPSLFLSGRLMAAPLAQEPG